MSLANKESLSENKEPLLREKESLIFKKYRLIFHTSHRACPLLPDCFMTVFYCLHPFLGGRAFKYKGKGKREVPQTSPFAPPLTKGGPMGDCFLRLSLYLKAFPTIWGWSSKYL